MLKNPCGRWHGRGKDQSRRSADRRAVWADCGGLLFGGLGRVIATLVGLYLATILAAFFYHPFSVVISFILRGVSPFTSDLVSFVVLLAVGTIAIAIALGRSFFLGRLPRLLGPFNNLSGMILGLLVALAATVLAATVISLSLEAIDRTAVLGGSATLLTIQRQMQDATLVPMFLKLPHS